jgi:predicted nucleotidyltransferase component of viral defense system
MILHLQKELFSQLIEATASDMGINPLYIEKDYWVCYVLKNLSQSEYIDVAIFKGGTSLSKAYKIIERFSEDIDLALMVEGLSGNQIKTLIKKIEKDILDTNFTEVKIDNLTSKGSQFRKTVHAYPQLEKGNFGHATENIILEINSFSKPTQYLKVPIATYISELLYKQAPELIEEHELKEFEINVLDIKRTFCEKISAIARASYESDENYTGLKNKIRHFYDIYFLMQQEEIKKFIESEDFISTIKSVRVDDSNQFGEAWTRIEVSKTPIFLDTKNVMDRLKSYYQTNFRDLVYSDTCPKFKEIEISIEKIGNYLNSGNMEARR